jgi:hypothetical protein
MCRLSVFMVKKFSWILSLCKSCDFSGCHSILARTFRLPVGACDNPVDLTLHRLSPGHMKSTYRIGRSCQVRILRSRIGFDRSALHVRNDPRHRTCDRVFNTPKRAICLHRHGPPLTLQRHKAGRQCPALTIEMDHRYLLVGSQPDT